jgi:hypothetical protein
MPFDRDHYRMTSDVEPNEDALESLMHEVAVEAKKKANLAKAEFTKRVHHQIAEALVREGLTVK